MLSADRSRLFYMSGSAASTEVFEARRATPAEPYQLVGAVQIPNASLKHPVWLSQDGCRLYVVLENATGAPGGADLFVAERAK